MYREVVVTYTPPLLLLLLEFVLSVAATHSGRAAGFESGEESSEAEMFGSDTLLSRTYVVAESCLALMSSNFDVMSWVSLLSSVDIFLAADGWTSTGVIPATKREKGRSQVWSHDKVQCSRPFEYKLTHTHQLWSVTPAEMLSFHQVIMGWTLWLSHV